MSASAAPTSTEETDRRIDAFLWDCNVIPALMHLYARCDRCEAACPILRHSMREFNPHLVDCKKCGIRREPNRCKLCVDLNLTLDVVLGPFSSSDND